jgi:hypothetical protein
MGTMRWQKELAEKEQKVFLDTEFERKTAASDVEIAELHDRLESLKRSIAEKQLAKSVSVETEQTRKRGEGLRQSSMTRLRQSEEVGSTEDRHRTD